MFFFMVVGRSFFFFFFQAEDGIRDLYVTGVQTCALPISKHGVEPAMVTDYGMSRDDAEVVVALTALTHCIGMAVHRKGHEDFSLFIAEPKLRELLGGIS